MPKFKVEFQLNERGVIPVTAGTREEAEEMAREQVSDGAYLKYISRSDLFVEAF